MLWYNVLSKVCDMRILWIEILLLCCFMMGTPVKGQENKEIAGKIELIFKDLRPAERKILVEKGVETWTSAFFSTAEKDSLAAVFQDLQNLRVSVQPELKNFVSCIHTFRERGEKENLMVWLSGLKKALAAVDRPRTVVRNYLVNTAPLVCEQVLYAGGGHLWYIRGKGRWQEGEKIELDFAEADLICKTPKDSIVIHATTVRHRIGEDIALGKGGNVKWRTPEADLSADLSRYRVELKSSEYVADSAWFRYDAKYNAPILGQLHDNALKYDNHKEKPYPAFTSYATDIRIDSLFRDMTFRGGISYAGMKFSGFGKEGRPAMIRIAPNDTIRMDLYAQRFAIDSLRILSGSASMVIQMDSGEITHPDVNFLYLATPHTVTIKRITEQSLHLPFKDTYHRILFSMEEIQWPVDSNYMEMRMSSRSGLFKATIESLNFFSDDIYDKIQGLDAVNPLNGLLGCSLQMGSHVFTIADYAYYLKKPADQLRKQIILLSYNDFVDYNEYQDKVTLKQRLYDYTKARVGKQDYDNIRFDSHPKDGRTNALLDVRNYTLKILGVDKFTISVAKDISVEPSDKIVTMLRNRDMEFNGKLKAGMFDMFGQNLFFSYDKYTIDLTKVDSTSMYLAGRNTHLRGEKIKSLIRDITGNIVIDKPNNKSGKKEEPGFPVLNSTKESYVYFDDPAIQHGEYKRDGFYFVIKPYTMKGINDASKFRYAFDGRLISNIVPVIEDTLKLMSDNALGLVYETPAAGLELYGKGRIRSRMSLDRRGFLAQGEVKINRSDFQSDTILMLPTRLTANTQKIEVSAVAGQRPDAQGTKIAVTYLPGTENLRATSTVSPFSIYDGRIRHSGTIFVYDELLDASGRLELKDAEMNSKLFNLRENNILSQSTALRISSIANESIQLNTSDVRADINLAENKGKFINNKEANQAEFTSNQYACSFKSFTWYMQEAYLNIGIEHEEELQRIWRIEDTDSIPEQGRNIFVSTGRLTDSLTFIAPFARYNLNNGDIDCRWVNHVDVANGRYYPDRGHIFINGTGGIREMTAGRLLCERTDPSKQLTNVTFRLTGRYNFNGSGDYKYVSEEKKTSVVRFSEISTDTSRLIYTKAVMTEEQPLVLNDGFDYKGDIIMHSRQPYLFFKGYVGLKAEKNVLKHTWLKIAYYLDAAHIKIPVEVENRDDKGQRIYNGFFLLVDKTFKPYATFMSKRQFYKDDLLIGGAGQLEWKPQLKQYAIADTLTDRYYNFRYDPGQEMISAYGGVELGTKAPGIAQQAVGDLRYLLKDQKLELSDLLYTVNFHLLSKMEAVLLKDFSDKKLKNITVTAPLAEKVYSLYGKDGFPAAEKQLKRTANNIPDSLNRMLVLDSLSFVWNAPTRAYRAHGKAHVLAIAGKPVEKSMNIKMELVRGRSGNEIFIYLYDDKLWYYFEYTDHTLYTLSSNEEYNTILRTEKADKKVIQTKEKEVLYTITLCPDSKKQRFVNRVK